MHRVWLSDKHKQTVVDDYSEPEQAGFIGP